MEKKRVLLSRWYSDTLSKCLSFWLSRNYDQPGSDEIKSIMLLLLEPVEVRDLKINDNTMIIIFKSIITANIQLKDKKQLLRGLSTQYEYDTIVLSLFMFFAAQSLDLKDDDDQV